MVTAAKKSPVIQKARLINKLGLHLRAAAMFIKTANAFKADIILQHGDKKVNGKSIMGLMALAAPVGSELIIRAKGADAKKAMEELLKLIDRRFGEPE